MKSRKTWPAIATLAALLLIAATAAPAAETLRVLILSGANNHDWKSTTPVLRQLIEECPRFRVVDVLEDPSQVTAERLERLRRDRQQLVGISRDGGTPVG